MFMARIIASVLFAVAVAALTVLAHAAPATVEFGQISLDGEWKLAVVSPGETPGAELTAGPDFPEESMRAALVPHNWEMDGFERARYRYPSDSVGFYRKRFVAPEMSEGQRLTIWFDGVLYGAEAWLNGRRLGFHAGGFSGFGFDVTDFVIPGAENVLDVKATKSGVPGHELFHFGYENDVRQTKKAMSGRVALMGNISPMGVLARGSDEEVRRACVEVLEAGAPGGGFIFATGGEVNPGTDPSRVRLMLDLAKGFVQA
jgi:hypothetical protein